MAKKIEVSRDNALAYVKAAATCIDASDDAVFEAFDAAECALEDGAPNAADLFASFCSLLDQRGITVTVLELSRAEKADQRAYEQHVAKNHGSNRGKTYGYPI
jgi:hypothetical protein